MAEELNEGTPPVAAEPVVAPPPPEAGKPDVVSREDFTRLQSVYDKKIEKSNEDLKLLNGQLTDLTAQLEAAKAEMPKEQADKIKAERDLRAREATLKALETTLKTRGLGIKARELLAEYKIEGMTVEQLVAMGDEGTMELSVLRAAAAPKTAAKVPGSSSIDKGSHSTGAAGTEEARLDRELERAKGK